MSVRIDSLSVTGLGPIASVQWSFKDINLIYGKNEQGKTFLVEYLLRSLFNNVPATRGLTDSGQVVVSGFGAGPRVFHPRAKEKIEDFVLPTASKSFNLSRLCVVKGGEPSMTSTAGETVTKAVLKDYLSDQRLLDKILERVPGVVRTTTWDDGVLIHQRQAGLIKNWAASKQDIERISELLAAVDSEYSQGQIKNAELELKELKKQIDQQLRARRIYAFHIAGQIREVEAKLDILPEAKLAAARSSVEKVRDLALQFEKLEKQVSELQAKTEHYQWLKAAIEECEKRPEGLRKDESRLWIYLFFISLVGAIIGAFLSPYISIFSGLLAMLFAYLVWKQYQTISQSGGERQEVEKIYSEFEAKFGKKANSIATLKSTFEPLQQSFFQVEVLNQQISEKGDEFNLAESEKNRHLVPLLENKTSEIDAYVVIDEALRKRGELSRQLSSLREALAALNLNPDEYLDEDIQIKYDPAELNALEEKSRSFNELIVNENAQLQSLKQRICDLTRDKVTANWDELIEHLRTRYESAIAECKSYHAQIIGGMLVNETIDDLRKLEDENIYHALRSKSISGPIKAFAPDYSGVDLDGEDLVVFNEMQRFSLSALSTGAKEQILMALRVGLASHILGDQKMFLILDDAFQHSDWTRREILVKEIAALAQSGWQIFYFSMDDHIKRLFEERVRPIFQERYQSFELSK